jgi:SLOG-like protein
LLEAHFRLALGEIARCVLVSGGLLAYGGHLKPDGYTAFLVHELERYSRRDRPLRICLAWSEHQKIALSEIEAERRRLGLYGEIVCLDVDGKEIDPSLGRSEDALPPHDGAVVRHCLTQLRLYMGRNTQGRVFIGGKREGFQGEMPGLLEEALFALEEGQPVYLAGGFGGITWDIARELGIDDGAWFPQASNAPAPDERVVRGMARLRDIAGKTDRRSLENGLTEKENRQLAACHRPSEIAALVSLGLGRKFGHQHPEGT